MALISSRTPLYAPDGMGVGLRAALHDDDIEALPPESPDVALWCKQLRQMEPTHPVPPELVQLCVHVRDKPSLMRRLLEHNIDLGRYALHSHQYIMNKTLHATLVHYTRLAIDEKEGKVPLKHLSFFQYAERLIDQPVPAYFFIDLAWSVNDLGTEKRLKQLPLLVQFWKQEFEKNHAFVPHPLTTMAIHGIHNIPTFSVFWNHTSPLDRIVYARYALKELPFGYGKSIRSTAFEKAHTRSNYHIDIDTRMDMLIQEAGRTHPVLEVMKTLDVIQKPDEHELDDDVCKVMLSTFLQHMNASAVPESMTIYPIDDFEVQYEPD